MTVMEITVTFIDRDGGAVDEIVDATNNGTDIVLSSHEGAIKLVLSTDQVAQLLSGESLGKAA